MLKILSVIKNNKFLFKKYSNNVKNGIYVLLPNLRTFVRCDGFFLQTKKFFPHDKNGSFFKRFFKTIAACFCFVHIKNSCGQSTATYITNTPNIQKKNVKCFNFISNEVLIFCSSEENFQDYLKRYDEVKNIFLVGKVSIIDKAHFILKENLIKKIKHYDNRLLMEKLVVFYHSLFIDKKTKYRTVIQTRRSNGIMLLEHEQHIEYYQHGDLSRDNVFINDDGNIIFLDFEHADYFPAFYDFMFFIMQSALSYKDYAPLDIFNSGIFDSYFYIFGDDNVVDVISNALNAIYEQRVVGTANNKYKSKFVYIATDVCQKLKLRTHLL